MQKKYPLRQLALFAIPLLICILLMNSYSPPGEKARTPYNSVVIAMEFAWSDGQVLDTLDPLTDEEVHGLNVLNYIDFLFMLIYCLLLAMFIFRYSEATGNASLRQFALIAVFIFLADLLENLMMLQISSAYIDGKTDFGSSINFLPVFAWTKWGALAVTFAYMAIQFIQKGTFSQVLSILLFLPSILLMLTIADYATWINRFITSIFLAFGAILIFAACFRSGDQRSA